MSDLDALLAPLRSDPSTAGVLCDFDGTLSAIVEDPTAARAVDGAVDALTSLADRYAVVAVISGRPVAFLRTVLPESLQLVGLYGLEWLRGGELVDHPGTAGWRPVVERAAEAALAELPPGVLVEPKGVSLTVHHRTAPDLADEVEAWATRHAATSGLEVRPAKMSIELHPPVPVDKGTAVRSLVGGLRAACFVGDDVGDVPAFAALADLRAAGVDTLNVAVRTEETPEAVLAIADVVVDGPAGAVDVLRRLASYSAAAS